MTDVHELVRLLHRTDWTGLSLSAEVNDGSTVLVAPGMRYRYQTAGYMTGCDGGRPWELSDDDDDNDSSVHWVSGPEAPLSRLLCPAWLLESSQLEVRGRTRACGRDALDVVMTKPGYGIIAECVANDTALVYTSRGHFVEYDVLVREMPRWLRCAFISNEELLAGRWQPSLDAVLTRPAAPERIGVDGAELAAELIRDEATRNS